MTSCMCDVRWMKTERRSANGIASTISAPLRSRHPKPGVLGVMGSPFGWGPSGAGPIGRNREQVEAPS
jgi:hypothetical protein